MIGHQFAPDNAPRVALVDICELDLFFGIRRRLKRIGRHARHPVARVEDFVGDGANAHRKNHVQYGCGTILPLSMHADLCKSRQGCKGFDSRPRIAWHRMRIGYVYCFEAFGWRSRRCSPGGDAADDPRARSRTRDGGFLRSCKPRRMAARPVTIDISEVKRSGSKILVANHFAVPMNRA